MEVVINHLEPYKIEREPGMFNLEKEFVIDTERDEIAEIGLTDISAFDVDSDGNIYLLDDKNNEKFIFKFDSRGNFSNSFGQKGQGPGELQYPYSPSFVTDYKDEIILRDITNNKLVFFQNDGNLIKEIKLIPNISVVIPVNTGKLLILRRVWDYDADYHIRDHLSLYNDELKEIKKIEMRKMPNPVKQRVKASYYIYAWRLSNGRIYTGIPDQGYEIHVYDLNGNLIRKIRKEYNPVLFSEELKKKWEKIPKSFKVYFPDSMPPFHSFFTDNEGRLFVMTYEKGKNPEEYIYDIFNSKGIFIGRSNLNVLHDMNDVYAKIKNGRLYSLLEEKSGYKKLVAFKMKWE